MILAIEDNPHVREQILAALRYEGLEATGAGNGRSGLALAREHEPELILCDVMMPELDGYEVLRAIRSDPTLASTPFVFVTAKADRAYLRKGMELGADDYLAKPFTVEELLRAISVQRERRARAERRRNPGRETQGQSLPPVLPPEVCTPLAGIFSYAQLLIEEHASLAPTEILEAARRIHAAGVRLQRVIENHLLWARLQSEPDPAPCPTPAAWRVVRRAAAGKAKEAHRASDLILEYEEVAPAVGMAKDDLRKVVEELVDNALKFSEAGRSVRVRTFTGAGTFQLEVADTGPGMPPEGTATAGLGLAIARRLVERCGGELNIVGPAGGGTTVNVRLPACPLTPTVGSDASRHARAPGSEPERS